MDLVLRPATRSWLRTLRIPFLGSYHTQELGVKAYTPLRLGEGRYADTKPWLLRYHSCYPANASMYQIPTLLHQRLPVVMPLW